MIKIYGRLILWNLYSFFYSFIKVAISHIFHDLVHALILNEIAIGFCYVGTLKEKLNFKFGNKLTQHTFYYLKRYLFECINKTSRTLNG
jgi:hypothetical protein